MAFFSKLDNKSFTNKEDLIQHIVQHYVVEIQEGTQEKIIQKIQDQLPFVEVESVQECEGGVLKISVSFLSEEGKYLESEEIIVGEVNSNHYFDQVVCRDIDEVILYAAGYYKKSDEIKQMLFEQFQATAYTMESIFCGGHDSNPSIYFEFIVEGEKYEMSYDFGDKMEQLYNQIRSKFVKEIEGTVENYWDSCSNQQVFRLSGVDIQGFLKNGKKAKIEILD